MNLPSSLTKSFDIKLVDLFSKKDKDDSDSNPSLPTLLHPSDIRQNVATAEPLPPSRLRRWRDKTAIALKRHLHYIGPGIIASVAYIDAGNWVTDLSAGSQFGYKLCFTILMAGLFGMFLQIMAVRLGCATGVDLARGTRLLCLPEGPNGQVKADLRWKKSRTGLLWLNYLVAEGAIIATELAEIIGSGIALNL
jgi:metal iron transporter